MRSEYMAVALQMYLRSDYLCSISDSSSIYGISFHCWMAPILDIIIDNYGLEWCNLSSGRHT